MNWDSYWDEVMSIDAAYITAMGALVGYRDNEQEIHDAYAMLFCFSL